MKELIRLSMLRAIGLAALLVVGANPASADLMSYWNFNEGSGTVAHDFITASHNDGTFNAGSQGTLPSWTAGNLGGADKAVQVHGMTDRVVVPVATPLAMTNQFTIALWAKSDYLGSYPYLLEFGNNTTGDRRWFIQGDSGGGDQMYMWSDANSAWRKGLGFKTGGGGNAYTWHHYAFVYSGGKVTPYVDGVAKTQQTISGSPNFPTFTNIIIGGHNQAWTSWEGAIDDVAILNNATTATEVGQIMNGTYPGMVPEPSTLALLAVGLVGLVCFARRRK